MAGPPWSYKTNSVSPSYLQICLYNMEKRNVYLIFVRAFTVELALGAIHSKFASTGALLLKTDVTVSELWLSLTVSLRLGVVAGAGEAVGAIVDVVVVVPW